MPARSRSATSARSLARTRSAGRAAFVCLLAAGLTGCSTYRLEPLPPEERRPQARVPGLPTGSEPDTAPPNTQPGTPPPADPGTPGSVTMLLDPVDCAICAEMLEGRLRTVAGVGAVSIDWRAGRVLVSPRAGAAVSARAVREEAEAANFVVRSVETRP